MNRDNPARGDDILLDPALVAPPPPTASRGPLHPGAIWEGVQKSGRNSYRVRVTIETVDVNVGTLTGLLEIHGLTPQLDSLVTFFEGEIVGTHAGLVTGRWGATEADDLKHFSRFTPFRGIKDKLTRPGLHYNHHNKPFLFMRWKERFVVPEFHIENINGASYSGFYYLCLEFNNPTATPLELPPSPPPVENKETHRPTSIRLPSPSLTPSPPTFSSPPLAETPRAFSTASTEILPPVALHTLPTTTLSDAVTPKEIETTDSGSATSPSLAGSSLASSSIYSISPSTSSSPPTPPSPIVNLPTPLGTTPEEFPAPSSPPLPQAPRMRRSDSDGRGRNNAGGEKRPKARSRSGSSYAGKQSAAFGQWPNATITGFYHFRNSEPFQQLSLSYVPQIKRAAGGSQAFAFR
ncbi:hypothetical protein MNV49_007985 [Pseudohyphozyma bogoriensis]|nr:hypothetical protein MNV49_007985 [Pseudohyphozyma bogoriensis]